MKIRNLKISLLVLTAMFAMQSSHSQELDSGEPVYFKPVTGEKKAIIAFDNKGKDGLVKITDIDSDVVYRTRIAETGRFEKVYNLNHLQSGEYSLYINSGNHEYLSRFVVSDFGVELKRSDELAQLQSPFFYKKDELLTISYINLDQNDIRIKFYDQYGNMLFENYYRGEATFNKRFDLQKLHFGSYRVEMNVGNNVFTQNIEVE